MNIERIEIKDKYEYRYSFKVIQRHIYSRMFMLEIRICLFPLISGYRTLITKVALIRKQNLPNNAEKNELK